MYLMVIKGKSGKRTYEYIRLCESVWKNGRSTRRTVATLGRKDLLEPFLDRLYEICRGSPPSHQDDPVPLNSFRFGPFLALRTLWQQFGMPAELGPLSDRVLVMVANRLTAPASEHGLADWLRTYFACDSQHRRFAPALLSDQQREARPNPRVRVEAFQLQRWYRTLDALLPLKNQLEEHLFSELRSLFHLQCDLVFYDLTSTFFEGAGPQMARRGYSRDHRPDAPQVMLGVAMVDGFPVAHTLFEGNRRDSTTVGEVVADLRQRFGLGRFVFVGDRGMRSEQSVAALEQQELGYLMAVKGRRSTRMEQALKRIKADAWQPCQGSDGEAHPRDLRVQEVTRKDEPVRRFLVHSPERERHERKLREAQQKKVRGKLERLQTRVARGVYTRRAEKERQKEASTAAAQDSQDPVQQQTVAAAGGTSTADSDAAQERERQATQEAAVRLIGDSAGRILACDNGHRYYDWRLDEAGRLEFWENDYCAAEKRREGYWLLETEETGLTAVEAVRAYQDLWRVEFAFRQMKDALALRPVWHQTDERVQAHVLIASLALTFDRILQRKLKDAGLHLLSSRAAWKALEAVSLVEFELPDGKRKTGVCTNGADGTEACKVLRAIGAKIKAPQPPGNTNETVH